MLGFDQAYGAGWQAGYHKRDLGDALREVGLSTAAPDYSGEPTAEMNFRRGFDDGWREGNSEERR